MNLQEKCLAMVDVAIFDRESYYRATLPTKELVAEYIEQDSQLKCANALRVALEAHGAEDRGYERNGETVLVCRTCGYACHSSSGLNCDSPDGEFPCYELKKIAEALGVTDGD